MRMIAFMTSLALSAASATAFAGDACVIPMIVAGEDTVVEVPYIDKQFCGMVMLNGKYERIDAIADKVVASPVECNPAGTCAKKIQYIFADARRTGAISHTIIFVGPREKPAKHERISALLVQ